jgi:UDP-galactopyranose mutase
VVIGAGPAGLGAALALGESAVVLERGADAGGLAATVTLGGAIFDLGGHSFHTPHAHIRSLVFDALPMEERRRDAWCHVNGEMIPYPFQQHFDALHDAAIVAECRAGLERAGPTAAAANFDEHIERRYGAGIARHFLRPYNEKLWGRDLTRLESSWTSERVAPPSVSEAPGDEGRRTPLRSGEWVAYPARGGYGEIFRALAARVPVRFNQSVARVDPLEGEVVTQAGERFACRHVISTLPLPALLDLVPGVPAPLRQRVAQLAAVPLTLVLVALDGRLATQRQRIYCAGASFPGHKVVLNHSSSNHLAALPHHGVLVEVSEANGGVADDARLVEQVIRGLREMQVLEPESRVASTSVIRLPLGYPVPTHARAAIVEEARRWLRERRIATVGRFGEWAYINSDEALHRGLQAGAAIAAEA